MHLLEQNLKKSETNNASLREDLHFYLKSKSDFEAEVIDKASEEVSRFDCLECAWSL